jgi:hypothetical protein
MKSAASSTTASADRTLVMNAGRGGMRARPATLAGAAFDRAYPQPMISDHPMDVE